jgi:hypothetical protein
VAIEDIPTSCEYTNPSDNRETSGMLEEPDISSLLDALNSNRVLLARTRICLARLQRNPRRYHGRIDVNAPRKIAYMINLTPGLARRVLEDPRFQEDSALDVGVMKKSERLLLVYFLGIALLTFRNTEPLSAFANTDVLSPSVCVIIAKINEGHVSALRRQTI